ATRRMRPARWRERRLRRRAGRAPAAVLAIAGLVLGCGGAAAPADVVVAVAANFVVAQEALAEAFERETGMRVSASPGSTGQLYAQIRNGAPYDVLLAADAERPRRLESEGLAVAGTRFTYALGRLVVYGGVGGAREWTAPLRRPGVGIALGDARTSPYGAAAEQALAAAGAAADAVLVRGENIGQA